MPPKQQCLTVVLFKDTSSKTKGFQDAGSMPVRSTLIKSIHSLQWIGDGPPWCWWGRLRTLFWMLVFDSEFTELMGDDHDSGKHFKMTNSCNSSVFVRASLKVQNPGVLVFPWYIVWSFDLWRELFNVNSEGPLSDNVDSFSIVLWASNEERVSPVDESSRCWSRPGVIQFVDMYSTWSSDSDLGSRRRQNKPHQNVSDSRVALSCWERTGLFRNKEMWSKSIIPPWSSSSTNTVSCRWCSWKDEERSETICLWIERPWRFRVLCSRLARSSRPSFPVSKGIWLYDDRVFSYSQACQFQALPLHAQTILFHSSLASLVKCPSTFKLKSLPPPSNLIKTKTVSLKTDGWVYHQNHEQGRATRHENVFSENGHSMSLSRISNMSSLSQLVILRCSCSGGFNNTPWTYLIFGNVHEWVPKWLPKQKCQKDCFWNPLE